jgi:hypothetical protein
MARKGSDFLTGFMQGFNQAGGMQRVSNWAAKKSGSYDVFQDPFAMQAYSRARQIGTPAAQQEFVDKYGQYVDTQEGTTPTEMFFGKETPTYMGMNKGQFLNTAVQALSSGAWDENEFGNIMAGASEAYGEDLTNNPFLSAFMQEQPDMKTKFLNDRWTQAAFDGNEFAQNLVSQEYGDFLSNYVDVPEEFVNPDERISYIQNEIFAQPEEGPSFYENINNPIEFLAARAALDENYNLEGEIANYNAARETTADDITAQMVRTYMEQMQPEQERLINLGELGLPGGEIPISEAGQYINVLNGAINYQKTLNPQGADYGPTIDGSQFGIEGQIPLKYASGIAALLRLNGGGSPGGGPGAGSVDISQWPIINFDKEGPIRRNPDTGFLMRDATIPYVNKDGQLVQAIGDEEMGYQYQYHDTFVQPQGGGGGGEEETGGFWNGVFDIVTSPPNTPPGITGGSLNEEYNNYIDDETGNLTEQAIVDAYKNTFNMTEEQLLEQFQANKNNVQFVSDFENTNNITIEEMINYLSNNGVD